MNKSSTVKPFHLMDGHIPIGQRNSRNKILLMAAPAFPSDTDASKSQIVHHAFDTAEALVVAHPRDGEFHIREDEIEAALDKHGDQIAVVASLPAVNFFTLVQLFRH
jgi:hypothetical protein